LRICLPVQTQTQQNEYNIFIEPELAYVCLLLLNEIPPQYTGLIVA